MQMNNFSWLHLTDFHFGLSGQKTLWPNLREPFLNDLTELHKKTGPWHAIFFTGDLVQQGGSEEFKGMQEEVLDRLWRKLKELGSGDALLIAVPGNHDLIRPDPKLDNPAIDALLDHDRFASIAAKFWDNASGSYRTVINNAFAPYSEWWNTTPNRPMNLTKGMLPGDFSCSLTVGDRTIGIVGLNTAFLQLKEGDYQGKLVWGVQQLNTVCNDAVDDWVKAHSLCLLLTHQGPDWLTPDAKRLGENEIVPAGRFAVHLFGHMHETSIKYIRTGGSQYAMRELQGCSAFGMEKYGNPAMELRSHGYAAGRITFESDCAVLRIWPRIATDLPKGNGWRYVADHNHAVLLPDDGTAPENVLQLNQLGLVASTNLSKSDPIPAPPVFYASPPYIGSHPFVGRQSQLDILDDWASPADTHSILLFEAIGGTGKSLLTWEWATKHSPNLRTDWAGKFWYSFYEKGATMLDFCRRALGYMSSQPVSAYKKKNTTELTELLIHQLQAKPWLLILDGLERVLVSYHRIDAAQIRDEDAGKTDEIAHRDPCSAINPEDDDLLRALAGVIPSKVLVSTRLTPRTLLNNSNQPIPGVLRNLLPGLRPQDAEDLIRSCGISGTSSSIQNYLKTHCDCHPLVIGVLAGLINDYLPDRGNFDAWSMADDGGLKLNLAKLDLVQKRNNILEAAFVALEIPNRQLLSTIALLTGSIDYQTLCALNPQLPSLPEAVSQPKKIKRNAAWFDLSELEQKQAEEEYLAASERWNKYRNAINGREEQIQSAAGGLTNIVKDLERRGLLQYDQSSRRYDLHPVVRGIAAGGLKLEEKNHFGRRVVDHFSFQARDPYHQAETLDDFDGAKNIVKTLFQMGRREEAWSFIEKNHTFLETLNNKFEAHNEILTIIRPFFMNGWSEMPDYLIKHGGVALAKRASVALRRIGALQDAAEISTTALRTILSDKRGKNSALFSQLISLASTVGEQNHLALEDRLLNLAGRLLPFIDGLRSEAYSLARFRQLSTLGKSDEAENYTSLICPENSAIGAHHWVVHLYQLGKLTDEELLKAENIHRIKGSALGIRNLLALRGYWLMQQGRYAQAKDCLQEALARARKAGKKDKRVELWLAVAQHNLGELADPHACAERLAHDLEGSCHLPLSTLWLACGDRVKAADHAIAAYKWAWADGKPFMRHGELIRARALLELLNIAPPKLDDYNPVTDKKYDWEQIVEQVIRNLEIQGHTRKSQDRSAAVGRELAFPG